VTRREDGYEFTASCDSLLILVREMETEIYHLNRENAAFKTSLNESKTVEVSQPSGLDYFQIWAGRILLLLAALYFALKKFKLFN
jgi:hypothetical protein